MMADYEKIKEELNFTLNKNEDLQQNLNINVSGRRKAEDDLLRTVREFDEFKQRARDNEAGDDREIALLKSKVEEL